MKIQQIRVLRGPNLWSLHTTIQAVVHCAGKELHLDHMAGIEARLRERFPELGPLPPESSLVTALELTALGLQARIGCPVTFSRTVPTFEPGISQMVVEYSEEAVGRLAIELARQLCEAALDDRPFDLDSALNQLRELHEDIRLGPSTGAIVDAATARGIPYRRLTEGSLVQLGWGSQQRRIQAAETDATNLIAESIAQDKELTKRLLEAAGVPVPKGRPVVDAADAWAAACEIGGPVVIKPRDGNQGRGVAVHVESREQIIAAYHAAREFSAEVMVEQCFVGSDYRLLVVGGRLIAAARRDPPFVTGNGKKSILQLVEEINRDPRRGVGHATALTRIRLDDIALATLAKQGLSPDSVPRKGYRVVLRNNANLSTGGTATDVTDDVHHELASQAIEAAHMIGLDLCGVDIVCQSVLRPLESQSGGVIEVNAAPGLRMHIQPSYGRSQAVGEAIVQSLFAPHENGRIPLVAVAGTNGKTTTVRLVAHLLGLTGKRVGMTNSDGIYIAGQRVESGDCSGPVSARQVLFHPDVDAAVFETARGGILREGLGFDRCNVAIVTNIGQGDHLGLNYISTVEDLAVVKRVIVHSVTRSGTAVLNAADPIVSAMAGACPGSITYFALDRHEPVLANHLAQGKRGVFIEDNAVVAGKGKLRYRIPLSEIPITHQGNIPFQIENVLAATGAAWGLGIPWNIIRRGLSTFVSDTQTAPGRFNLFSHHGATVIADYGHNPDAIRALVRAIDHMPAKRRIVVISGAGDRRDCDLREQTEILGNAFDEVILYQDQCQRGRADGEVLALLRSGLTNARRTTTVQEINGEFPAIDAALARLQDGDLCLILIDQIDAALAHITTRVTQG